MKKIFDFFQVWLQTPGFGIIAAFILVVLFLQAIKLLHFIMSVTRRAILSSRAIVFRFWGARRLILILLFSLPIYMHGERISAAMQYIEQYYIDPVYQVSDSTAFATYCYETELKKSVTDAEFQIIRDSTYSLAKQIGCEPIHIYEVAYSECALNPFRVRDDGIAAGWIQFTVVGLSGLGVSLSEVKDMCKRRDAIGIMALTGRYMRRLPKVRSSTDVYCAVFAPGKMTSGNILYSGWENPQYYLNKGLDGYVIKNGVVMRLPYTRDGVITKTDLTAALAYKKANLLKRYSVNS